MEIRKEVRLKSMIYPSCRNPTGISCAFKEISKYKPLINIISFLVLIFLLITFLLVCPRVRATAEPKPKLSIALFARSKSAFLRNSLRSLREVLVDNTILPIEVFVFLTPEEASNEYSKQTFLLYDIFHHSLDIFADQFSRIPMISRFEVISVEDLSLSESYNRAIELSSHSSKFVLFLDDSIELLPDFLSTLHSLAFHENGDSKDNMAGVTGCMLLNEDQLTIYNAGISFSPSLCPGERRSYSRSYTTEREGIHQCFLPDYPGRGYHRSIVLKGEIDGKAVKSVSPECMLLNKELYSSLDGFNEKFSSELSVFDFGLRASAEDESLVKIIPSLKAVHFDSGIDSFLDAHEVKFFNDKWFDLLNQETLNTHRISNLTLIWNMECSSGQALGFTTEAINFIMGLKNFISLSVEVSSLSQCLEEMRKARFPEYISDTIQRLVNKPVDFPERTVLILHRDPGRYGTFIRDRWDADQSLLVIGRSMFETDSIPTTWSNNINLFADEVWVPSDFNKVTFKTGGVRGDNLYQLPEPIDTDLFQPGLYEPITLPNRREFAFLSIGKWEKRKGWDLLVRAYLEEFAGDDSDSVSLFFRSSVDEQGIRELNELVNRTTQDLLAKGLNPPQAPIILNSMIPYSLLPSLYASVNCFVLPTRGEGWGLPIVEALSMGLPVIATNWSGCTQYLRSSNSYPIDVVNLTQAFERSTAAGHKWAVPSVDHLKSLMRDVYENRNEAYRKGLQARYDMIEGYSSSVVSSLVLDRIEELLPTIERESYNRQKLNERKRFFHPMKITTH